MTEKEKRMEGTQTTSAAKKWSVLLHWESIEIAVAQDADFFSSLLNNYFNVENFKKDEKHQVHKSQYFKCMENSELMSELNRDYSNIALDSCQEDTESNDHKPLSSPRETSPY